MLSFGITLKYVDSTIHLHHAKYALRAMQTKQIINLHRIFDISPQIALLFYCTPALN